MSNLKKEIRGKSRRLTIVYCDGKTRIVRASAKLIPAIARGITENLFIWRLDYQGFQDVKPVEAVNVLENDEVRIIF